MRLILDTTNRKAAEKCDGCLIKATKSGKIKYLKCIKLNDLHTREPTDELLCH